MGPQIQNARKKRKAMSAKIVETKTVLGLDIGATIGWALVDAEQEIVVDHGQCRYFYPADSSKHYMPFEDEFSAVVFASISGIQFGPKANGRSIAIQAYWQGLWENEMAHIVGSNSVFYVFERKPKRLRLAEVCALTNTNPGSWREHEADAAWIALKWARDNKGHKKIATMRLRAEGKG